MFSQNIEEEIILDYFKDKNTGTLLELGANNGEFLSNTRALMLKGWNGIFVEPALEPFRHLSHVVYGPFNENPKVWCFNVAIGLTDGEADFFESGTHLGKGDTGLLSTLLESETKRWAGSGNEFKKKKTDVWSFETLLENSIKSRPFADHFDLIAIDIEGMEVELIPKINFTSLKTKMVVLEWNGKGGNFYDEVMLNHGMKCIHVNGENRIYTI